MNASSRWPFSIFLLWAALTYSIGLYLFLSGFLLTRQTLHVENTASKPWTRFPLNIQNGSHTTEVTLNELFQSNNISAIYQPPFKKAVVVLIDALRFDFMPRLSPRASDQYYTNRLTVIQELMDDRPESSLLFQFRADPPTTTMQRLKALMTGSLPTFIDAGSNFASSEISEDHLLKHIARRFPNTYFFGDDTWTLLFGNVLNDTSKVFPFDSFKVFDLDTVDHGIIDKVFPLLEGSKDKRRANQQKGILDMSTEPSDWDFIITHFLGVDHCGHTFKPSHPTLAAKLDEMNAMLKRLIQYIDEDTLLVLLGDHGMSEQGDHGGESIEEVMSGVFLHSKRQLTIGLETDGQGNNYDYQNLFSKINHRRAKILDYDLPSISARLYYDATEYPIVSQINLVPTLSYLFGTPIPFGNLGSLIPDLLIPSGSGNITRNLLYFIQQFRINALQIFNYLQMYSKSGKHSGFADSALEPMYTTLYTADDRLSKLLADETFKNGLAGEENESDELILQLEEILMLYDEFLMVTLKYCKQIWAQFDVGCLLVGSAILIMGLTISLVLFFRRSAVSEFHYVLKSRAVKICTLSGVLVGVILSWLITEATDNESGYWHSYVGQYGLFEKMGFLGWLLTFAAISNLAGMTFALYQTISKNARYFRQEPQPAVTKTWPCSIELFLILAAAFVHALTLGSNSYIVFEDSVVRFMISSWCLYWLFISVAVSQPSIASALKSLELWCPLLVLIFVRISAMTGLCREEQQPSCSYIHSGLLTFSVKNSVSAHTNLQTIQNWLLVIYTIGFLFIGSVVANFLPKVYTKLCCRQEDKSTTSTKILKMLYGTSIFATLLRYVYVICENASSTEYVVAITEAFILGWLGLESNQPTHWLRFVIRLFQLYVPWLIYFVSVLLILTAVYGACAAKDMKALNRSAWTSTIGASLLLAILQRPIGGMIILCWPLVLQLLTPNPEGVGCMKTLVARLVIVHFLGEHLFFVSGHQAIITAIHWDTAYIGFEEMHTAANALLVILATLTGFIISWSSALVIVCEALSTKLEWRTRKSIYHGTIMLILLFNFIPTSFSSIFIFILRRHLMTWKIFAPRFLLQCILLAGSGLYLMVIDQLFGGSLFNLQSLENGKNL
ncbi:hypothetical protein INT43_003954 [Umbelopsis isabellina]|uniref:GPI ethanolamine phosphate transferase 3 n=1 Tax=Mortierella isabellina TaxID=91625 RepID=A0A8H7PUU7_MORIS|nr:hypothetical protein INT43_003954 [Umbelopsis isabellina]